MAEIHFECQNCKQHLSADSTAGGAQFPCPACSKTVTVPTENPSVADEVDAKPNFDKQPITPNDSSRRRKPSMLRSLLKALRIGFKQLFSRKLESVDLRRAELALAQKAVAACLLKETYPDVFTRIEAITNDMRDREGKSSHAVSITEDLKRSATKAKDKVVSKMLAGDLDRVLLDFARILVTKHPEHPAVQADVVLIKKIAAKIDRHNADIEELSRNSHLLVRQPLLLLLCLAGAAVVGYSAYQRIVEWQVKRDAMRHARDTFERLAQGLEQDKLDVQRRAQEVARLIQEETLKQAQQRLGEAKAREDRNAEMQSRVQIREDKGKDLEVQRLQEKLAKVESQNQLGLFASSLFESIELKPHLVASPLLGQTICEIKGQNFNQINDLHRRKEWLALISFLAGTTYAEYPEQV